MAMSVTAKGRQVSLSWIAVLRVMMGLVFLSTWLSNLSKGLYGEGYLPFIQSWADGTSFRWYAEFLNNVIIPNIEILRVVQVVTEGVFMAIGGAILLAARRNMKGWDQPLKFVWFSFSGRLNRKAYWLKGAVALSLVMLAVQIVAHLMGAVAGAMALVILLPAVLFQLWASIAMLVKRSHDLGHSGWWALGMLVPIWNIWLSIQVMFFRGNVGPNTFGPDPIDPYDDYIAELAGGGGGGAGDDGGFASDAERPRPQPRPEDGAGAAPKGFGSRTFKAPEAKSAAQPQAEQPVRPLQDTPDMDLIRRRLGGGITGGGAAQSEDD